MELASQPKAAKTEMQVDQSTGQEFKSHTEPVPFSDSMYAEPAGSASEAKETGHAADGALRSSLSIQIPSSMLSAKTAMPPTPPPTPPIMFSAAFPSSTNHAENDKRAGEELFLHYLGVATDISGFDRHGDLILDFGT